jgi:hypothetical protein
MDDQFDRLSAHRLPTRTYFFRKASMLMTLGPFAGAGWSTLPAGNFAAGLSAIGAGARSAALSTFG